MEKGQRPCGSDGGEDRDSGSGMEWNRDSRRVMERGQGQQEGDGTGLVQK